MRLSDLPPHVQARARAILERRAPVPVAPAPAPTAYTERRAGRMNKTEARYADRLAVLRAAGEVAWFAYEGVTFRLPGGIRWTPDFAVLRPNGRLELHEVKGRKGATYYATEKARLKLRLARETLPLSVFVVSPLANGAWATEYRPPDPRP